MTTEEMLIRNIRMLKSGKFGYNSYPEIKKMRIQNTEEQLENFRKNRRRNPSIFSILESQHEYTSMPDDILVIRMKIKENSNMTKEQALIGYIKFMSGSTLPESKRKAYVRDARGKLNNLLENKMSDTDRYDALEKEFQEIRQTFAAGEMPPTAESFNERYGRFCDIGRELTTLWEDPEDIFA